MNRVKLRAGVILIASLLLGTCGCIENVRNHTTSNPSPQTTITKTAEPSSVTRNTTYVLYFWRPECPPCIPMMAKIDVIEEQYKGTNVHVLRLYLPPAPPSTDAEKLASDIALMYGVTAVPATIFVHNRNVTNIIYDAVDLDTLREAVENAQRDA